MEVIRIWYEVIISCVKRGGDNGNLIPIRTGLHQRCAMSPSQLNVFMDEVMMRKVTEGTAVVVMAGQKRVVDLDITDYVTPLADSSLVMVAMFIKI